MTEQASMSVYLDKQNHISNDTCKTWNASWNERKKNTSMNSVAQEVQLHI